MAYSVYADPSGPWLAIDYAGFVDDEALVASRAELAEANADGQVRDFILDFTAVTEFVLAGAGVPRIGAIDRERARVVTGGRCAIVTPRESVELGASYLGTVSGLDLDFRVFPDRQGAEAWLRGEHPHPPPPLPRGGRR